MTLSVIRGREAQEMVRDAGFQSQWTQLYEACPWATAFQSFGFIAAWHEAYKDRYSPLVIYESSATGELVGLISLATENDSGRVTIAGTHQAEYKAWLALPSNGGSFIQQALTKLAGETDTSLLSFHYLPPGIPTDWTRSRGMPWTCEVKSHPRPIVPVGDAAVVAEYLRKKMASKSIRSHWNRLKRLGGLRLEQIRETDQLAALFDELITYYDIRQGGAYGKFEFESDSAKKPFHLALLGVPNLLHVSVLKAGERIISAKFGVTYRGTYCEAMPMFSPFHAAHSPVSVHFLMTVQQLHKDGYSILDLTPGPDAFKDRFVASYESVEALSIYFRQRIKHKVVQGSEVLARRALRSLHIAPNAAFQH